MAAADSYTYRPLDAWDHDAGQHAAAVASGVCCPPGCLTCATAPSTPVDLVTAMPARAWWALARTIALSAAAWVLVAVAWRPALALLTTIPGAIAAIGVVLWWWVVARERRTGRAWLDDWQADLPDEDTSHVRVVRDVPGDERGAA